MVTSERDILWITGPWETLDQDGDSTVLMMRHHAASGHTNYWADAATLEVIDHSLVAKVDRIVSAVGLAPTGKAALHCVSDFGVVVYREDPPFTLRYLQRVQMLAVSSLVTGTRVVNPTQVLMTCTSKLLPALTARNGDQTVVSDRPETLALFAESAGAFIVKPVNGGDAQGNLRLQRPTLEELRRLVARVGGLVVAQEVVETPTEVRVWLHNGEPIAVASPQSDGRDWCTASLSEAQVKLVEGVSAILRATATMMAALDFVGDVLVDVNVNSPGRMGELSKACGVDIPGLVCRDLEALCRASRRSGER
ncbi:MAG: hypothetical protein KF773_24680 [Deltaproteobacteria bacterium]|nr:hypothetical protein [Deltaproteobacteria bacterium]